eukprot:gene102-biopygen2505
MEVLFLNDTPFRKSFLGGKACYLAKRVKEIRKAFKLKIYSDNNNSNKLKNKKNKKNKKNNDKNNNDMMMIEIIDETVSNLIF